MQFRSQILNKDLEKEFKATVIEKFLKESRNFMDYRNRVMILMLMWAILDLGNYSMTTQELREPFSSQKASEKVQTIAIILLERQNKMKWQAKQCLTKSQLLKGIILKMTKFLHRNIFKPSHLL